MCLGQRLCLTGMPWLPRRYMVVLRFGGVYADIDTECKQPLDTIIRSRDTLIVGWENEFPDAQKAVDAW